MDMFSLLKVAPESRDQEWEKAFLYLLPQAKFKVLEEEPKQGPDGFPYMIVGIDDEGTEPAVKVLNWLSGKGIGLVINPFEEIPDYVLTYGQIWNFKERGQINSVITADTKNEHMQGQFKLEAGQKIHSGEPNEEYLPNYVRDILREFFGQQGLDNVRISMISADKKNYDFCFSLESMKNPSKLDHRDLLEAISWFLPGHYSLALISEKGIPNFVKL